MDANRIEYLRQRAHKGQDSFLAQGIAGNLTEALNEYVRLQEKHDRTSAAFKKLVDQNVKARRKGATMDTERIAELKRAVTSLVMEGHVLYSQDLAECLYEIERLQGEAHGLERENGVMLARLRAFGSTLPGKLEDDRKAAAAERSES